MWCVPLWLVTMRQSLLRPSHMVLLYAFFLLPLIPTIDGTHWMSNQRYSFNLAQCLSSLSAAALRNNRYMQGPNKLCSSWATSNLVLGWFPSVLPPQLTPVLTTLGCSGKGFCQHKPLREAGFFAWVLRELVLRAGGLKVLQEEGQWPDSRAEGFTRAPRSSSWSQPISSTVRTLQPPQLFRARADLWLTFFQREPGKFWLYSTS